MISIAFEDLDPVETAEAVQSLREHLSRGALVAIARPDGTYTRATEIDPTVPGRYLVVHLTPPTDAEIVRHYQDRQISGGAVATELGIDSNVVYAVLRRAGVVRPKGPRPGSTWAPVRRRVRTRRTREAADRQRAQRLAAAARQRVAYKDVHHGRDIRALLVDTHESPVPVSPTYDHALTAPIRHAFEDAWWRTVSWSFDPDESDARVLCDLCGAAVIAYRPTGGLVVCRVCWRLTATEAELEADRIMTRDRTRARRIVQDSEGRTSGELPMGPRASRRRHDPVLPPSPAVTAKGLARMSLVSDVSRRFGLRRSWLFQATSESLREAMATDDAHVLMTPAGRPLKPVITT